MPQRGVHHSRLIAALVALALVAACGRAGGESIPADTTTPLVPTATVPATATAPSSSAPAATATVTVPSPSTPAPTAILTPTPVPSPSLTRPPDQQVELPDVDAHYDLEVTAFDPGTGHLEVVERVTLRSRSGPLPELHFTVTPAEAGYFQLDGATLDNQPVTPDVRNDGFTLTIPAPPGETAIVGFRFTLNLRQVPEDWYGTGLDGNIVRLGYWFPILSDDHPYPSTADPAYTRTATFDVRIPIPPGYVLAHTGEEVTREPLPDGAVRYHLRAENVRDFAMITAPDLQVDTATTAGGVQVELYSLPGTPEQARQTALSAAVLALDRLSELIGPYPYPVFRMAEAGPSLHGGIEFPMLVYLNLSVNWLDRLTYHETAHQWLYGIIGTRPQQDPWIDEGGAQFLEAGLASDFQEKPSPPPGGYLHPLDSTDAELPSGPGIPGYESIYRQGHAFYQTVYEEMGPDAFWAAMRELYERFRFDIVTPWDVLLTWQLHSPVDLRPLFRDTFSYPWLDQLPPPGG